MLKFPTQRQAGLAMPLKLHVLPDSATNLQYGKMGPKLYKTTMAYWQS